MARGTLQTDRRTW